MANLDLELVRHALTVARQNGFAEVELALGEDTFSATLEPAAKTKKAPRANGPVDEEPQAPTLVDVRSSLVGFYREASSPLQVGIRVEKGDIVAVLVALGIANDLESPASGEVLEVLVEPNQPVEYGQVLARIKP
jgi:biotin carboxyl carrier protein